MYNAKVISLCVFIAFGGFLFGYDIGVISGCLIMPDFINRFGEAGADGVKVLSAARQSEITALLSAGTFIGSLAQSLTADRLGRRGSCMFWSAIFTVGVVIQTAADTSLPQILGGRFVAGLGVGALSCVVPLFTGEAAPRELRGTLLVMYQLLNVLGLFAAYLVDLASHGIAGSASWRIPVGLQILYGVVLITGCFILPESPRHLVYRGHTDKARRVIATLNSTTPDSALTEEILTEFQAGFAEEEASGGKAGWRECFAPGIAQRTIIGMMLQGLQQFNGQNFYYYYGDTFFASAGTGLSPYAIQCCLGAVTFATTIPALYLIETLGRRRSLIIGALSEAPCALIAALVGHFMLAPAGTAEEDLTASQKQGGSVLIAFALLQISLFGLMWGPTPWVYLGESFPMRVRAKCISLGAASNWFWNFLLGYFSPRIAADIGPLILLVFAGMLVFAAAYTYAFVPETKGLSLEQVDEMYRSGVRPWHSSKWQPATGARRQAAFTRTMYKAERDASSGDLTLADGDEKKKARSEGSFGSVGKGKPTIEMIENAEA